MRGAREERTEPYELYGEGVPERATKRTSFSGVFSRNPFRPFLHPYPHLPQAP